MVALALSGWLAADPGMAQSLPPRPPLPPLPGETGSGAAAPADPDAIPPYGPEMERLAERLGTLAFLRDLCGNGDAAAFRERMGALIDAEGRTPSLRSRLAGAFNRGVTGYAASYRACTPSARLIIDRSLSEADRLTHDLQSRFGGS